MVSKGVWQPFWVSNLNDNDIPPNQETKHEKR
jgi:hypothetical protein